MIRKCDFVLYFTRVYFHKKMNVNSQIHSFEPTLELYKGLIEKYKNDKTIKINNIGVGKEKDKLTFYWKNYLILNLIDQIQL